MSLDEFITQAVNFVVGVEHQVKKLKAKRDYVENICMNISERANNYINTIYRQELAPYLGDTRVDNGIICISHAYEIQVVIGSGVKLSFKDKYKNRINMTESGVFAGYRPIKAETQSFIDNELSVLMRTIMENITKLHNVMQNQSQRRRRLGNYFLAYLLVDQNNSIFSKDIRRRLACGTTKTPAYI